MIGATVGNYCIVRQIGEGGMGAVYLGEHVMLGRPAAIKVLLPGLSQNREIVGRFFNEARATTAIRHPGIVEIYDFGFLPDGAAYIAMEMLDGESLASRLRRVGRLPVAAAIDISRQIAAALHAAHTRGITHRDLKPDNVFLVPDPEIGERVKLLDFGIAKLVSQDQDNRTRTGVVMGTPVYMSPEQCRGTATLDGRADLYSLGCVLYELLSGRPPFVAESLGDIIAHHLYFQPDLVRKHEASVPEPLEALIMALLAKDPAHRPTSAGHVSAILEGWRGVAAKPSRDAMHAAGAMRSAVTVAPSSDRIVAAVPTTLSGSAAMVAAAAISVRHRSRRRWLIGATIATVLAAGAAIAVVLVMRRTEPVSTITASQPLLPPQPPPPTAPAPAAEPPAAVSAVAPPHETPPNTSSTSLDKAAPPQPVPTSDEPRAVDDSSKTARASKAITPPPPRKPAREAPSRSTKAPPVKSPGTARPAPREDPTVALAITAQQAAPSATPPASKPAPIPEVGQNAEPQPAESQRAEPSAAAKPTTSKWGRLTGDKSLNVEDYSLVVQCKRAAAAGNCPEARAIAARLADRNVALYRAKIVTDAAIAACLNSK